MYRNDKENTMNGSRIRLERDSSKFKTSIASTNFRQNIMNNFIELL